jgi:hypothetical protein
MTHFLLFAILCAQADYRAIAEARRARTETQDNPTMILGIT